MNKMMMLSGAAILALGFGGTAQADPKVLDCYNVKGHVVACKGNFPDGTDAAGADFTLFTKDRKTALGHGKMDKHGIYLFKAPPTDEYDEYIVVIAGPSLLSDLTSTNITTRSDRPGWGGDWVPVTAVDELDKLQQWRDQFLSDTSPVADKVEQNVDR
jgi:hypothetical protein